MSATAPLQSYRLVAFNELGQREHFLFACQEKDRDNYARLALQSAQKKFEKSRNRCHRHVVQTVAPTADKAGVENDEHQWQDVTPPPDKDPT